MNTKHTAVGQSPNTTGNITISVGGYGNTHPVYTTMLGGGGGGGASYSNIVMAGGYQLSGGSHNWTGLNGVNTTAGGVQVQSSLKVSGNAEFTGDLVWKGRSLGAMLEKIEQRLAILVPDPARLEKYEALKQAYDNYKILEALCIDANDKEV